MSSGFVSAGVEGEDYEGSKPNDEWLKVKQELEESRQRRAVEGQQEGGKSLYEVLQQNKAAKQEAFEESIRLKNQFRTLDEDEVEFLDSILESTHAKEEALQKETSEKLELFHRQREEAEKALLDAETGNAAELVGPADEGDNWAISGRKRRRPKEKEGGLLGLKRRRSATAAENNNNSSTHSKDGKDKAMEGAEATQPPPIKKPEPSIPTETKASTLGLGAYSSDEDD
ncbi:hypothetical protein TRV_01607 [Trichophyton verrucosum HKI 0517]|uniref:FAM192A/Fyv6 N-terminal domain-containing protein n=1 Tax=Trichophyton verrucosum (strain HKI 0517) TaxID=663202 RepID=D4D3E7_TRIVH|nr:uncharacterized protein TRV_01607 [Trichophyton verrucosum HKI 0517]EFE43645.1 hypothetical protein TRV_01607 [Trichophyton verrucosum HKI 0517]